MTRLGLLSFPAASVRTALILPSTCGRGHNCFTFISGHTNSNSREPLQTAVVRKHKTPLSSIPTVCFPQNTKAPIFTACHYYCFFRCPGLFLLITQSQSLAYTNNLKAAPRLGITLLFVPHGNYYSQFKTKTLKFWLAFIFPSSQSVRRCISGFCTCKNDFSHTSVEQGEGGEREQSIRDYKR